MANDSKGQTQEYQIKSGQGFMIFPKQINTYIADNELPWEYIWIEFDGLRAKELIEIIVTDFEEGQVLTVGEVGLDPLSRQVTVAGQEVHLTKTEYAILKLFLQHPNQALSKSVILERISLDTPDCTDSSLKQHMSNLRKKLRQASGKEYLQSVWGIGFRLTAS